MSSSHLFQYKKQQRELQFQFRKKNCEDVPVLTIDQCQGKEADIVAISMVKKPTGFLNKNRLNVALSRVRRKLYFVADMKKFEEASRNSNWECSEMAKDLLKLAAEPRISTMERSIQSKAAATQQSIAATEHLLEHILARLRNTNIYN
jgi:hypothetical protein